MQVYMTRKDAGIGVGLFDSIKWAFEVHVKTPDTKKFNYAMLHGWHEDAPDKIEFWCAEPNHDTLPDFTWTPKEQN